MAERFVLYSSSLDPFSNHQEEKRASIPTGPVEPRPSSKESSLP